ncbi:MAG: DUF692 domain-containing protein [Deltaproteobacteria bacterium]|nr:DUF692 domain-containing protein [Deltaproteobacteria bacterium]
MIHAPHANRFGLPNIGLGLGLRSVHYAHILEHWPAVDWFEVISENYMHTAGRPLYILDQIRERYPVVLHGVSLSIGSTDPLDMAYLGRLKALRDRVSAPWVSDHLCWTGVQGKNTHDLLPMPYTQEALQHTIQRVRQVQDFLEAPILLENPSSYVEFSGSTLTEYDFLAQLAEEADCGLLLDVNNVYVASYNHGYDPMAYLDALPMDRVVQFHVAGHSNEGTHIIDTHIGPVIEDVWGLYKEAYARCGGAATLLEWDQDIPSFEQTWAEAERARRYADLPRRAEAAAPPSPERRQTT